MKYSVEQAKTIIAFASNVKEEDISFIDFDFIDFEDGSGTLFVYEISNGPQKFINLSALSKAILIIRQQSC